ncbi:MAG: hypothetical protein R2800_14295 [Flavipsychrobacter sp.]
MQKFFKTRNIIALAAIIALAFATSCNSTSKYGCPNKLHASSSVN